MRHASRRGHPISDRSCIHASTSAMSRRGPAPWIPGRVDGGNRLHSSRPSQVHFVFWGLTRVSSRGLEGTANDTWDRGSHGVPGFGSDNFSRTPKSGSDNSAAQCPWHPISEAHTWRGVHATLAVVQCRHSRQNVFLPRCKPGI